MDVFVFSSKSETQGMVLTEAMAAGTPVIALDAPGAREVVRHKQNGLLLPGDADDKAFSRAICDAVSHPEKTVSWQSCAIQTARDLITAVADLASPTGQWPEPISPLTGGGCMGDGQHGWAAAEWIMMMRNLFIREEGDTLILGSGIFPEWFEQDTPLSFGPTLVPGGAVAVTFIPSDKGLELVLDAAVRGRPIPCKAAVPGYRPGHLDTSRGDVSWNRYRPWIQGPAGRSQGFTGHDKAGIVRPMKYYAVATGRTTGIFTSWPEAKAQVEGFPGAVFKSFKTREQAQAFLADPVLGTGRKKTASSSSSRDNGPEGSDNDWPEGTIVVYTDGSAIGNPGPGGYGVVIREHPDAPAKELSGGFRHTTNNRMEMTAVIKALQALQGTDAPVVVHSDSRYVVDALTKGWARGWEKRGWKRSNGQPALNPDLWEQLLPLVRNLDVRFVWVRGHSGNPLNERCDELANTAARQQGDPDGMA